jgi:hypothetical protein
VKNGFNCIWRILADFLIGSGGLQKNHLATLERLHAVALRSKEYSSSGETKEEERELTAGEKEHMTLLLLLLLLLLTTSSHLIGCPTGLPNIPFGIVVADTRNTIIQFGLNISCLIIFGLT